MLTVMEMVLEEYAISRIDQIELMDTRDEMLEGMVQLKSDLPMVRNMDEFNKILG